MKHRSLVLGGVVVGLLSVVLSGCGPAKYEAKTTGSEATMQKVQQGQPMYTPPPGAPVPGAPTMGGAPQPGAPGAPGAPR